MILHRFVASKQIVSALREWFRGGFGVHVPSCGYGAKGDLLRWEFRQHPTSRAYLRVPSVRQDIVPQLLKGEVRAPGLGDAELVEWISMALDDATHEWFMGAPTQAMGETMDPEAKRKD